jgi:hypothetical protein
LAVADRDLTDASVPGLSADWRLNIAYNATLQLASAALVAAGYRAGREGHHHRPIQSLRLTVSAPSAVVDQLDLMRRKRNIADYQQAGRILDCEANEMHDLARLLRRTVAAWLSKEHPELL